ncbi:MAG: SDR family NAD(P)-dependent oxidoreductase [Pseudomonadota bacterium]
MSTASQLAPPAGRRIAVVGAAGGIGRALVAALLEAGCQPIALDLPTSLADSTLPDGVPAFPIDATDDASLASIAAKLQAEHAPLDGLVNLAGFAGPRTPAVETPPESWDSVVAGNLTSAHLVARHLVPLMRDGREAAMVLTSSGLALKATPGYGPYAAAKAGVLALTRTLAQENAPWLRVNAVAPGAVDTPFLKGGTGRTQAEGRFDRDAYVATVPLARMAEPGDVVDPILFLLGPASRYMTGQTLHVNGGLLMP